MITEAPTVPTSKFQTGLAVDEALFGQAGLATYVAARVFGDVALPAGMPFWMKSAIEQQAEQVQRLPGIAEWTIASENGRDGQTSREEREKEQSRQTLAVMRETFEAAERERELQEWQQTSHSLGTIQMTGAEWQGFGEDLREGGILRDWLLSRIMRDGKTQEEAEVMADRVASLAEIMAKPEGQRTEQETAELERAKQDKELQTYLEAADEKRQQLAAGRSAPEAEIAQAEQSVSMGAGADEFAGPARPSGAEAEPRPALSPADTQASAEPPPPSTPATPLVQRQNAASAAASGFTI